MTPTRPAHRCLRVLVRYLVRPALFGLGIRIGMRLILSRVLEYCITTGDQRQELLSSIRGCQGCQSRALRLRLLTSLLGFHLSRLVSFLRSILQSFRRALPRLRRSNRAASLISSVNPRGGMRSDPAPARRECPLRLRSRAVRQNRLARLELIRSGRLGPEHLRNPELILDLRYSQHRRRSSLARLGSQGRRSLLVLQDRRSLGRRRTVRRGRR